MGTTSIQIRIILNLESNQLLVEDNFAKGNSFPPATPKLNFSGAKSNRVTCGRKPGKDPGAKGRNDAIQIHSGAAQALPPAPHPSLCRTFRTKNDSARAYSGKIARGCGPAPPGAPIRIAPARSGSCKQWQSSFRASWPAPAGKFPPRWGDHGFGPLPRTLRGAAGLDEVHSSRGSSRDVP